MMNKMSFFIATLGSILFLSPSCSKKNSPAPAPACKLVTVVQTTPSISDTVKITYNNDGKVSTMKTTYSNSTSALKVFTYSANNIFTTTTYSFQADITTDSIVINNDGLITYDLNRSGP